MLTREQQAELNRLESRQRKSAARSAVRRVATASAPAKQPDIHVHVTVPEQKTRPVTKPDPVIMPAPRKWVFEHKYDEYGKLIKSTATAQ